MIEFVIALSNIVTTLKKLWMQFKAYSPEERRLFEEKCEEAKRLARETKDPKYIINLLKSK